MNYELYFWLLATWVTAFMCGRVSVGFRLYVGTDEKKYDAASFGILLKR